jgi:hypothetical protein
LACVKSDQPDLLTPVVACRRRDIGDLHIVFRFFFAGAAMTQRTTLLSAKNDRGLRQTAVFAMAPRQRFRAVPTANIEA